VPNNGNGYYSVLGGNSINIDFGWMRRQQLSPRFALGRTFQYSFYNYNFQDAVNEPEFNQVVLKGKDFTNNNVNKQVYRSHNIAIGGFTRFYLIPSDRSGKNGLYIDLGAQGDFAFSRYAMLKTESEKKRQYYENNAFNPLSASAIVRVRFDKLLPGDPVIYARYRFTDAFNQKKLPMDLPSINIGIQFF
jgi:hypothetical protein